MKFLFYCAETFLICIVAKLRTYDHCHAHFEKGKTINSNVLLRVPRARREAARGLRQLTVESLQEIVSAGHLMRAISGWLRLMRSALRGSSTVR